MPGHVPVQNFSRAQNSLRAPSEKNSSPALFRVASLEDFCVAAVRASPYTLLRFYGVDVGLTPGCQVLSA